MDLSIPYYEDLTRISNSNIGWFLSKGPAFLHKMLTNPPKEEKNAVLERGTMIHEYLLQPEEFDKDYVLYNKRRPSSAQQEKFCQAIASSLEIEPNKAVLNAYKDTYSIVGKSEEKMLSEGLKIASELKDYIELLKSNDNRKIISDFDSYMLNHIGESAKNHWAFQWLFKEIPTSMEVHHEFHINWEKYTYSGMVKCKSLLDYVAFDFKNKHCIIADLKTTQNIWTFEHSVDKYDYLRQLEYYTQAVKWYLAIEKHEDPSQWSFDRYFIPIDTTGSYEIRVLYVKNKDIITRQSIIDDALNKIGWHLINNKWDHSLEYYKNDGIEQITYKQNFKSDL